MTAGGKQRIAVLGGGLGSLATVFELTDQPGWDDRFEITVYQQGWRLGGKCSSGHEQREGFGNRIYEHGLHVFAGFYHYAFEMLDRAYVALGRPDGHPNQRVWDAFTGQDTVTLIDHLDDGTPLPWNINFEPNLEVPGTGDPVTSIEGMLHTALTKLLGWPPVANTAKAPVLPIAPGDQPPAEHHDGPFHEALNLVRELVDGVIGFVDRAEAEVRKVVIDGALGGVIRLVELEARAIKARSHAEIDQLPIERFLLAIYLFQTLVHGILRDDVLVDGFDPLDRFELSEWLFDNAEAVARAYKDVDDPAAAAKELIDWAPIVAGYDYVFGYTDGDTSKPAFGAGTALRAFLRLAFGYKGHLFWLMRGAMADVVIAPLYLVLRQRGVRFELFNRITSVNADESLAVTSIDLVEQVQPAVTGSPYLPLIAVPLPGWPVDMPLEGWPAEPLWDQLADGAALKAAGRDFEADFGPALPSDTPRTLVRGTDFDLVVLGISLGALPVICARLPVLVPAWQAMFQAMKVTRTLALQLWFTRSNEDLGNPAPGRTVTGGAQPLSTWADMSHLLARETWGLERPLSIAYFCGQMAGGTLAWPGQPQPLPGTDNAKARADSIVWLKANAALAWPRALSAQSSFALDPALLFAPLGGFGEARFEQQYWRANTHPSDLYVQSVPNSVETRLYPGNSGFSNLYLCGDWTRTGLNAGAAEAAVMSGVQCANAIAGIQAPIAGELDVG